MTGQPADSMRRSSVLHILPSADRRFGGPVTAAAALVRGLQSYGGVDVTVLVPVSAQDRNDLASLLDGASIRLVTKHGGAGGDLRINVRMLLWLRKEVHAFDVVHVHLNRRPGMLLAAWMAVLVNGRVIIQPHGMCRPWDGARALIDRLLVWPLLRRTKRIALIVDREARDFATSGAADKCVVLGNALPPLESVMPIVRPQSAPDSPPRSEAVIVWVGRLHPRKRVMDFCAIARRYDRAASRPPASFYIIGPDEGDLPRLRAALASDTSLAARTHYMGELGYSDTLRSIAEADVLIHTAVDEPFGMVLVEALRAKTALILGTSAALGARLSIAQAALVVEHDVAAFCQALDRLLRDPLLLRQLQDAGSAFAEAEFSLEAVVQRTVAVYKALVPPSDVQ